MPGKNENEYSRGWFWDYAHRDGAMALERLLTRSSPSSDQDRARATWSRCLGQVSLKIVSWPWLGYLYLLEKTDQCLQHVSRVLCLLALTF